MPTTLEGRTEARKDPPFERAQPCRYLDFSLLTPRMEREVSVVLSRPVRAG